MKLRRLITKRACVRLTLLLVAGAIANVVVAWGLRQHIGTVWIDKSVHKSLGAGTFWTVRSTHSVGRDEFHSDVWNGFCNGCDFSRDPQDEYRAWSLRFLNSMAIETLPVGSFTIAAWGLPLATVWSEGPQGVRIPRRVHPIWSGVVMNTVFYAAILWLLFAAPFALRRRWRGKRGLCPKCAYDLRGRAVTSDVCPECGTVVEKSNMGAASTEAVA